MAQSPWQAEAGGSQGRIAVSGAPEGTYVYELGHSTGFTVQLAAGDYHEITQNATPTAGTKVVRVALTTRPPTVAPPDGVTWVFSALVDGDVVVELDITEGPARVFRDIGIDVANLAAGAHDFTFKLTLTGPAGNYEVELPGCAVDTVLEDSASAVPGLLNRYPEDGFVDIPRTSSIAFDLVSTSSDDPDITRTTVYVDGVSVFAAGTFAAGWTSSTYGGVTGLGSDVVRVVLTPDTPFASEALVTVRAVSAVASGPAAALDATWSFTASDETIPTVLSAAALSHTTVQVVFSETVDDTALEPGAYAFTLLDDAPGITPDPPAPALATGTVAGPFELEDGDTIVVTTQDGTYTATLSAVAATITSVNAEPFALADGDDFSMIANVGVEQTLVLDAADFVDITNATAAELVTVLNTWYESIGTNATASAELTGEVTITSGRSGTSSRIEVTGGAANVAIAFSTTAVVGSGDVANASATTASEVVALVEAAAEGVTVVETDAGYVEVATTKVGPNASLLLGGTALTALGLEALAHVGTSGVSSVSRLSGDTVLLTLNEDLTDKRLYEVAALAVLDTSGNAVAAPNNAASFTTAVCPVVDGRSFNLIDMLPRVVRELDDTGDYETFCACIQVVIDELLCDADRWTEILDPRLARIDYVEEMLAEMGNPFDALQLTDTVKRKLVLLLRPLLAQRGSAEGIVNAIRLFTGIEVVHVNVGFQTQWKLPSSKLGVGTIVGTSDLGTRYQFDIICPVVLTDAQRATVVSVANIMRRAPCRLRNVVEPTEVVAPDHWALGYSFLGTQTTLHSS